MHVETVVHEERKIVGEIEEDHSSTGREGKCQQLKIEWVERDKKGIQGRRSFELERER